MKAKLVLAALLLVTLSLAAQNVLIARTVLVTSAHLTLHAASGYEYMYYICGQNSALSTTMTYFTENFSNDLAIGSRFSVARRYEQNQL